MRSKSLEKGLGCFHFVNTEYRDDCSLSGRTTRVGFRLSSSGHYVWRKADVTCHCRGRSPSSKLYTLVTAGGKPQRAEPFPEWQALSDSHLWPLSDHSSLKTSKELSFLETVNITLILGDLWPVIQSKAQQWAFLWSNHADFWLYRLFLWADIRWCLKVCCCCWKNFSIFLHKCNLKHHQYFASPKSTQQEPN